MIKQEQLWNLVRCYGADQDRLIKLDLNIHTAGSVTFQRYLGDQYSLGDIGIVEAGTFTIVKECELVLKNVLCSPQLYRKFPDGFEKRMTNENPNDFSTRGAVKYLVYKR